MCGIIGYSGDFGRDALLLGRNRISHRGPDDSGLFIDERAGIGLGHVRLSILDVSPLGHQPMVAAEGSVVIVFNGEIYNFRELRAELERNGHSFRGHSDTEVLLRLYIEKGERMLSLLNGMFAVAIWDASKNSLLIARDGLGVKPLYYAVTHKGFAFASEIKGLMALVPDARDIDVEAIYRYLAFLWCPGEGTPLKAVRKLAPGEALWVRDGRPLRKWRWHTPVMVVSDENRIAARREAIIGTAEHLRRAVHRQMVADVQVGAFLSGGLDSSAVVTFARERDSNIRCFTIELQGGHDPGFVDDLPYAQQVARHLGVHLDVVKVDSRRMAEDLPAMVMQLDEPLADPAPLNVLYISRLAREQGIKVLLSGAGGDDIFTGYRRHRAVQLAYLWRWMPSSLRRALSLVPQRLDQRHPWARRLVKFFHGADARDDYWLAGHFLWASESDLRGLLSSDFSSRLPGGYDVLAPMLQALNEAPRSMAMLDKLLILEQRFFLPDHNLVYADKMSMAAGVEVRVPFLDNDLVDFSARVPVAWKQRGGQGKWVLKKAMEPYLPADVIYRPKSGFGAPLRRWMQRELRPLLADVLSPQRIRNRGLFDPVAVEALIAANDSGRRDASYTLFALMCIELWCRYFLDAGIDRNDYKNVNS